MWNRSRYNLSLFNRYNGHVPAIARIRWQTFGRGKQHMSGGAVALIDWEPIAGGAEVKYTGGSIAIVTWEAIAGGEMLSRRIQFIDEPRINTQGVIATHVTVQSPTASYTAVKPDTPVENIVERQVDVDAGDEAVCKMIADQLLDRWGREQLSITGTIPLDMTFDFKEKIRVVIPTAGLDSYLDEYVLQRLEHDIAGQTTTVVLGDIVLGEDELMARILQDLETKKAS